MWFGQVNVTVDQSFTTGDAVAVETAAKIRALPVPSFMVAVHPYPPLNLDPGPRPSPSSPNPNPNPNRDSTVIFMEVSQGVSLSFPTGLRDSRCPNLETDAYDNLAKASPSSTPSASSTAPHLRRQAASRAITSQCTPRRPSDPKRHNPYLNPE